MQANQVFEWYKPLRNHLRKVCLADSLSVIWAYTQNLQLGTAISSDIDVHGDFLKARKRTEKIGMVSEWELETLCRELILNAQEANTCPKTFRAWSYFAGAVNKLKSLESCIYKNLVGKASILAELHRIAHRQFPWQAGRPTDIFITRYFKVYSHPAFADILYRKLDLTTQELFYIGFAFFSVYLGHFSLSYPPKIEIPGITIEAMDKFLKHFSLDVTSLRQRLAAEQEMNEKFAYAFSSLRAYPLIRMTYQERDNVVCPLPTLFFWRLTNGVYYELYKEEGFAEAFGEAFQRYVGEVIGKALAGSEPAVYSEMEYHVGKNRKNTIDWIVADNEAALFIESKTKRLIVSAKIAIETEGALDGELTKMADFILQAYKTINDYRENHYPHYQFKKEVAVYPLIVTLEDWYVFGTKILGLIHEKVVREFEKEGFPLAWLDEMPYSISSVQEFEMLVQIIKEVGINKFMERKLRDKEKSEWSFYPFIRNEFPNESRSIQFLFTDEYEKIFPIEIRNQLPG